MRLAWFINGLSDDPKQEPPLLPLPLLKVRKFYAAVCGEGKAKDSLKKTKEKRSPQDQDDGGFWSSSDATFGSDVLKNNEELTDGEGSVLLISFI